MPEKQTHTMTGSSLSAHVLWQSASGCSKPACLLLLHITTEPSMHWATWPDSSDQTPHSPPTYAWPVTQGHSPVTANSMHA